MAPVTLAGALAQQHAEALAGLVMTQTVRPGAPFVYGGFTSNVDMKSGAPAFGTPEYMKTAIVGGQLARRLGLPYRSSNANAANSLDPQAAYESVFSLWGAIMGGVNFLMHGAGWMEGGLQASFEKMALDAELLAMVAEFLRPLQGRGPGARARRDARGRSRRALLRRRAHPVALPHRLLSRRRSPTGAITRPGARPGRRPPSTRPSASSPSACATMRPRRSSRSGARRSRLSSPAARRRAARRPTFERPRRAVSDARFDRGSTSTVAGVFFAFGVGIGLWGGAAGAHSGARRRRSRRFRRDSHRLYGRLSGRDVGGRRARPCASAYARSWRSAAIAFGAALCALLERKDRGRGRRRSDRVGLSRRRRRRDHECRRRPDRTAARPADPRRACMRRLRPGWRSARFSAA